MNDTPPAKSIFSSEPEEELARYRSVSVWAVAALLLGLSSAAALFGPLFWVLPMLGAAVAGLALWRIRQADPPPLGYSAAVLGLFISLLFAAAAPAHYFLRQARVRQQAQVAAYEWLNLLRQQQYAQALEATFPPNQREPLDERLSELYEADELRGQRLDEFLNDPARPLIRTLGILLHREAEVRFYRTERHVTRRGQDDVSLLYAVTFEEAGARKSFFLRITLIRQPDPLSARGLWRIAHYEGPVRP